MSTAPKAAPPAGGGSTDRVMRGGRTPNLGDGADSMLAALAKGHAANSKRLDGHDAALDGHAAQLDGHKTQLNEHHDRIAALEKAAAGHASDASSDGQ